MEERRTNFMTNVMMPQLGETVADGTVTKWLKNLGDMVTKGEPLFEVSTDKVDTEIPAPADGILSKILVAEGETVDVGTVLAVIGGEVDGPEVERDETAPAQVEVAPRVPNACLETAGRRVMVCNSPPWFADSSMNTNLTLAISWELDPMAESRNRTSLSTSNAQGSNQPPQSGRRSHPSFAA
jgi:pyruvate/2-oxoglutarate dehydrogenase complex dihydrolipoamide acyltransferase (E2) component